MLNAFYGEIKESPSNNFSTKVIAVSCKKKSVRGSFFPVIPGKFDRDGIPAFLPTGCLPMAEYASDESVIRTSPFRCTLEQIESHLCWSEQRRRLVRNLRN